MIKLILSCWFYYRQLSELGSLIRCHGLNGGVHVLTLRLPQGCSSEYGQSKSDEENGRLISPESHPARIPSFHISRGQTTELQDTSGHIKILLRHICHMDMDRDGKRLTGKNFISFGQEGPFFQCHWLTCWRMDNMEKRGMRMKMKSRKMTLLKLILIHF